MDIPDTKESISDFIERHKPTEEEKTQFVEELVVTAQRLEPAADIIAALASDVWAKTIERLGGLPDFDVEITFETDPEPTPAVPGRLKVNIEPIPDEFVENVLDAWDQYLGEGTANENWYAIADLLNQVLPELGDRLLAFIDLVRELWKDPYWDTPSGAKTAAMVSLLAMLTPLGRARFGG